jgi:hypothetical protein
MLYRLLPKRRCVMDAAESSAIARERVGKRDAYGAVLVREEDRELEPGLHDMLLAVAVGLGPTQRLRHDRPTGPVNYVVENVDRVTIDDIRDMYGLRR